ncbi:hypothetical protein [Streptomyces hilarionis]|uniref:hypothetical protein n=1 Tax=Streptomyces hilarionis TaxID=2839954 RepID=UPI002119D032|nr:hypothetical protein [Streptomyces hilarionis]MCQ9130229.1 hypothetical protein [Streptomyces hilarionis]
MFFWQVIVLFPVIHRLREANSALRFEACLDLLETVGSLLLLGGILLRFLAGESWIWLGLAGFLLLATVYAVKGVHWRGARRHPRADPNGGARIMPRIPFCGRPGSQDGAAEQQRQHSGVQQD